MILYKLFAPLPSLKVFMNDKDQSTIEELYNFIYDFGGFPFVEIPSLNDSKSLNIDQTMIKRFKYHNHTLKLFHQSLKQ